MDAAPGAEVTPPIVELVVVMSSGVAECVITDCCCIVIVVVGCTATCWAIFDLEPGPFRPDTGLVVVGPATGEAVEANVPVTPFLEVLFRDLTFREEEILIFGTEPSRLHRCPSRWSIILVLRAVSSSADEPLHSNFS